MATSVDQTVESPLQSDINTYLDPKSEIVSDIGSGYHIKPNDKVVYITKESNQDIVKTRTSPLADQQSGQIIKGEADALINDLI